MEKCVGGDPGDGLENRIRRIVHELNQPLAAILANAGAGKRMLERGNVDHGTLIDIMGDIAADDRRAAELVQELRKIAEAIAEGTWRNHG